MKKLLMGIGIAAMVMGMAAGANAAYDPSWVIKVGLASNASAANQSLSTFGTLGTANDAFGTGDVDLPSTGQTYAAAYTNISGKSEIYVGDMRGSFDGVAKTWDIFVVTGGLYTANGDIYLSIWNPKNTTVPPAPNNDFAPLGGETISLYDVTSGSRSLLWTCNPSVNGTGSATDANTFTTKLASGANTKLQLEVATAVPEPGSMVAMLSGLAGLVGFGIRRRK